MREFDLVVIGSGPGGYRAAVLGALRGLSVAIVEKGVWGGTCLNRGCVPKKAWHASAMRVAQSAGLAARGVRGTLTGDLATAWDHQHRVVDTVRESYVDYLKRLGVAAFAGAASFADSRTVRVAGGETLRGRHVIVATGSAPFVPPGLPRTPGRILTTDDLFDAPPPPGRRVAVVGSGVVGTELAFILAMLGCQVKWITNAEPLSRTGFSPPALKLLYAALKRHGVVARTRSRVQGGRVLADGVELTLPDGARETVDWVLLGSGRVPYTESLDLAAAGVATDADGFVAVDERCRTTVPHIYAIGDVANPAMTSNHALAEAAVAVADILDPGSRRREPAQVPELVYSALELGRVGLSEDDAEDRELEAATGFAAFEVNPAALGEDDAEGFVRLVADGDSGKLLGAEIVGAQAGELIHVIAREVGRDDGLRGVARMLYNHPSRAEEFLNAAETLASKWGLGEPVFGAKG
jgi:dihydrolipoamide dehydrogenase